MLRVRCRASGVQLFDGRRERLPDARDLAQSTGGNVDLSGLLGAVGERNAIFPLPLGRGDEAKRGSGSDPRDALGRKPRDIYIPDLRIEGAINVKTRDFR